MLVLNKEEASLLSKESSIISMSKRLLSWIKKDGLVLITDGKITKIGKSNFDLRKEFIKRVELLKKFEKEHRGEL